MSQQDRQGVRTATDLERKYNFGQTFAEVYGLIDDARDTADEAVEELDNKLNHEEIFNRLTNYGEVQGIYRENDDIYINASYIKTGMMDAERIDVENLDVNRLNMTGAIAWADLASEVQIDITDALNLASSASSSASSAQLLAQQIAEGEYANGSFIDHNKIYSPEIYANEFNVFPESTIESGSFNLYGYYTALGNTTMHHFLSISYADTTPPVIVFSSPGSANASWDFPQTFFYGDLDFNNATVNGLSATFG